MPTPPSDRQQADAGVLAHLDRLAKALYPRRDDVETGTERALEAIRILDASPGPPPITVADEAFLRGLRDRIADADAQKLTARPGEPFFILTKGEAERVLRLAARGSGERVIRAAAPAPETR